MHKDPSLATASEAGASEPAPPSDNECPRCHKPLIDPLGLGWCKSCGFCKSLEAEKSNSLLAKTARGPTQATALAGAAGQIPIWFWVLVLGIGGAAGLSFAVGEWLPRGNNLQRALWTSLQMAAGLAIILVGQLIAVFLIAPEDEKLSFKDAIMPTRLMGLILKRMPRLAPCLWTFVWGLTLIASAVVFIGGLKHWFSYLPNSKNGQVQAKSW